MVISLSKPVAVNNCQNSSSQLSMNGHVSGQLRGLFDASSLGYIYCTATIITLRHKNGGHLYSLKNMKF